MKKSSKKLSSDDHRSGCPISCVLDLVGDKWTLLIVRDLLFFEKSQYKDFADSNEKIPTNILADRLKRLEAAKIVTKRPYQNNPVRYQYSLTPKGKALFPVLKELVRWANKYIPGTIRPDPEFLEKIKRRAATGS